MGPNMSSKLSIDEIGARINAVSDYVGGKRALSHLTGIHETGLHRYIRGDNLPSLEAIQRLAEGGGVSLNWLLFGEGEMVPGARAGSAVAGAPLKKSPKTVEPDYAFIPVFEIRAGAGHGVVIDDEHVVDTLAFKRAWVRKELGASPADLVLIYVQGESMEPTLREGDVILLNRAAISSPPREGIYALRIGNNLLVKRLQALPSGVIQATSDNRAYGPLDLSSEYSENWEIIGRVVWVGRRI